MRGTDQLGFKCYRMNALFVVDVIRWPGEIARLLGECEQKVFSGTGTSATRAIASTMNKISNYVENGLKGSPAGTFYGFSIDQVLALLLAAAVSDGWYTTGDKALRAIMLERERQREGAEVARGKRPLNRAYRKRQGQRLNDIAALEEFPDRGKRAKRNLGKKKPQRKARFRGGRGGEWRKVASGLEFVESVKLGWRITRKGKRERIEYKVLPIYFGWEKLPIIAKEPLTVMEQLGVAAEPGDIEKYRYDQAIYIGKAAEKELMAKFPNVDWHTWDEDQKRYWSPRSRGFIDEVRGAIDDNDFGKVKPGEVWRKHFRKITRPGAKE